MLSRIKNHGSKAVWGVIEYFFYPLLMFCATPLFIKQLGVEQYGQWMLLIALNGLGGVTGLGMGAAVIKEVSAHRGADDLLGAVKAVRASLAVTLVTSAVLVCLFAALSLSGLTSILLAKVGNYESVSLLLWFAAALITLEQIDTVFTGAIRGMERFDVSAKVEAISKLLLVVCSAIVALMTHSLEAVLWSNLLLMLVRLLLKAKLSETLLEVKNLLPMWDIEYVKKAFHFGKWVWLQSIGSAMFSMIDRLLVASLLGPIALTQYSVCLQLAQQVHTIPSAGAMFMFPLISRRVKSQTNIQRFAWISTMLISAFALILAVSLVVFGHLLLEIWISQSMADSSTAILIGLVIAFMILSINIAPHYVLLGSDSAKSVAVSNLFAGLVSLIIGFILIEKNGIVGAVWLRIIYSTLICTNIVFMIFVIKKQSKNVK
jgi:O-antigen/teichoic acid export membrane protein